MEYWLVISALLLVLSLMPYAPSGHWVFRNPGFFRVQFVLLFSTLLIIHFLLNSYQASGFLLVTALLLIGCLDNVRHAFPYSRAATRSVRTKPDGASYRLITANVYQDNEHREALMHEVESQSPDFLLLLETDERWDSLLKEVCNHYRHSVAKPLNNYYGIHFFSKYPIQNHEVRFLVSTEVPSVKAEIQLPEGVIHFYGIHPEPPSPTEKTYSDYRDAEMMKVAEEIRKIESGIFLVSGDLNDVAWSKVTTLFQKKSGLLDPRRGRGLYSTFHANFPQFLRFPVDHLFHSKQIGFKALTTIRLPGSDHLAIQYDFTLSNHSESLQEDQTTEKEEEEIEQLKHPKNHQ